MLFINILVLHFVAVYRHEDTPPIESIAYHRKDISKEAIVHFRIPDTSPICKEV